MSNQSRISLSIVERRAALLRLIEQQSRVTVAQICSEFAVSEATARRDLDALAGRGVVERVHGGAVAVRKAPPEPPVVQRTGEQAEAKRRIGRAAAALVQDGETVFLGSGTTVYEVARALVGRSSLTVITNSLFVIDILSDEPGVTLVSLGGLFRRSELSFIGHIAEQALAELRADKVIIGIRAVDPEEGLTNDCLAETRTDRAILRIGQQTIVVADHTKLGRVSTAFVAPTTDIDVLITDQEALPALVDAFRDRGVRVIGA